HVIDSKSLPLIKYMIVNDKDKQGIEEGLDLNCPSDLGKARRNQDEGSKFLYLVFNKRVVLPDINVNIVA
ncbi:MAG: hypothetical protein O4806_22375, partial [Trichodesmium sp. St5_bin8]|nr:hypothetical protein [Trichodesmium sp. St5_bin8]